MKAAARARVLAERCPGPEPPAIQAEAQQAQRVAGALSTYRGLAPVLALGGRSASELQAELDALPEQPAGELSPSAAIQGAYSAWEGEARTLALHHEQQPADPQAPDTPVPSARLRELATELEAVVTLGPRGSQPPRQVRVWPAMVFGGVLMIAGVIIAAAGLPVAGALAVVAGIGLGGVMVLRARSADLLALRVAEAARRQTAAEALARELSLPADPAGLRALASEADTFELGQRSVHEWQVTRSRLVESRTETATCLRDALAGRGMLAGPDLCESYRQYEADCTARHGQAVEAARRPGLEEALRQRRDREREAAEQARRREEALGQVREAAASCGVTGSSDADLAAGLDGWLDRHSEELKRREAEVRDRAELRNLLAGGTLDEFEARADGYRRRAEQLAEGLDPADLDSVDLRPDPDARLNELATAVADAREVAARAEGEASRRAKDVPSAAAAEEELNQAEEELCAVQELARIISLARRFLQGAQDQVHRDIAPVLKLTLEAWLPSVTGGRYREVIVTPETLQVRVRASNGEWRDADRLSQGTREQIYLLLRLALVEHLTRGREVCPLILDDVTVQCDGTRTVALLDLLHQISRRRQVVLFSQEDDVRAWAERRLDPGTDRLIELDSRAVPA